MTSKQDKWWIGWIGAGLLLATMILYWPARQYEFINIDDPTYVLQNPKVSQGVTWPGVVWAFTDYFGANWHPLTWISHMVDVSLFGFQPAGHHLVNVGLHALNAALLFLLLWQTTQSLWRSALVAAVFAWHPTHVESVAWISERKDVLSTFFGLLTLMAYAAYAKARGEGRETRGGTKWHDKSERLLSPSLSSIPNGGEGGRRPREVGRASRCWYVMALGLFACGLMSKPMLVTWPCVMLLLDFWPLNRITRADGRWQMVDGKRWRALLLEKIPFFALTLGSCVLTFFAQRAGGAVQSMEHLPLGARVANAVVSYARYLGKTFWPAELSAYYPHPLQWPDTVVLGATLLLIGLAGLSLWLWRKHSYVLVGWSWFLGTLVPVIGLVQVGGQAIADRYLYIPQIGILIATVWGAGALANKYRVPNAVLAGLAGLALLSCGWLTRQYLPKWQNSVTLFQHALTVDAVNPPALYSLGLALCGENKYAEALPYLEKAAALSQFAPAYQGQLALAYESLGDTSGAIERYRKCLELAPDLPEALNNLAWLLATSPEAKHRNGADAVRFATRACELTQYDWPMFLGTLAASYAEAGRFPEAVATAEKAEQMARKRGFTELAERNAELLKTYRAGQPHREPKTP